MITAPNLSLHQLCDEIINRANDFQSTISDIYSTIFGIQPNFPLDWNHDQKKLEFELKLHKSYSVLFHEPWVRAPWLDTMNLICKKHQHFEEELQEERDALIFFLKTCNPSIDFETLPSHQLVTHVMHIVPVLQKNIQTIFYNITGHSLENLFEDIWETRFLSSNIPAKFDQIWKILNGTSGCRPNYWQSSLEIILERLIDIQDQFVDYHQKFDIKNVPLISGVKYLIDQHQENLKNPRVSSMSSLPRSKNNQKNKNVFLKVLTSSDKKNIVPIINEIWQILSGLPFDEKSCWPNVLKGIREQLKEIQNLFGTLPTVNVSSIPLKLHIQNLIQKYLEILQNVSAHSSLAQSSSHSTNQLTYQILFQYVPNETLQLIQPTYIQSKTKKRKTRSQKSKSSQQVISSEENSNPTQDLNKSVLLSQSEVEKIGLISEKLWPQNHKLFPIDSSIDTIVNNLLESIIDYEGKIRAILTRLFSVSFDDYTLLGALDQLFSYVESIPSSLQPMFPILTSTSEKISFKDLFKQPQHIFNQRKHQFHLICQYFDQNSVIMHSSYIASSENQNQTFSSLSQQSTGNDSNSQTQQQTLSAEVSILEDKAN